MVFTRDWEPDIRRNLTAIAWADQVVVVVDASDSTDERGEFAVFDDRDPRWLERIDQLALEIHLDFGDTASLIERLRRQRIRHPSPRQRRRRVTETANLLEDAYCRRL